MGTFSDSSGNCSGKYVTSYKVICILLSFSAACAAGCRECTGPNNSDCLACEDETLCRVVTDELTSSACLPADECDDTTISAFGDCTCDIRPDEEVSLIKNCS